MADIDGSERQVISPEYRGDAKWSPDGERLAFRDREGNNTYVYDVALAETRRVGPGAIVDWIDDQTLLVSVE
jgi:Tol biopolymer transport system component